MATWPGRVSGRLVVLTLILLCPFAWAADEAEPPPKVAPIDDPAPTKSYTQAREDFDAVMKTGEAAEFTKALDDLVKAAVAGGDAKQRKDVRKTLKRLLKRKEEAIKLAALQGYGILALPSSSRDLKAFVDRKSSGRKSLSLRRAAIAAWARISDPGTHEDLLAYIKLPSSEAPLMELAVLSATELGHFRPGTKKQAFALLDDFAKAYDMVYSAGIGAYMASALAADWWETLEGPMLETFNLLAETKFERYTDCRDWWRETRRSRR